MTAFAAFSDIPRWVAWRSETRNGKPTKVPYSLKKRHAKTDDPTTWIARFQAEAAAERLINGKDSGGIGIVLGDLENGLFLAGLDLDSCIGEDKCLAAWAERILSCLPTYAEYSPSGHGLKSLFYLTDNDVPQFLDLLHIEAGKWGTKRGIPGHDGGDHGPGVEIYCSHRYFAVTERLFPGCQSEIATFNWEQLQQLAAEIPQASSTDSGHRANGKDNSRSAKAMALGGKMRREGKSFEEFVQTAQTNPETSEWARTKGITNNNRELRRIWDKVEQAASGRPPEYSEDALALRFTTYHAGELRYVAKWGHWMLWNGSYWQEEDTLKAFDLARRICRDASSELTNPKAANDVTKAATVAAVERLAKADRRHATKTDQWDPSGWLFNPAHPGTIDLRTGKCRPYRQEDYITKIAGCTINRECTTPIWTAFLQRITANNEELQAYLQRAAGYCLTGITGENVLFFLYGTGRNGKGVFLRTLHAIWGDYAAVAPMEMFVETRNERHPTDLASLRGARLVITQEVERNQRWAESKIKSLTGSDPVTARFMRQDPFTFDPQFKLMIGGNHKPSFRGVDEAIRARIHLVPFVVTIPPAERDRELFNKLKPEWPGILTWALDGCLQWQKTGLNPPKPVRDATEAYLEQEDTIGLWIGERCGVDEIYTELASDLYVNWKTWADTAGERPISQKRFSQSLIDRGFKSKRQGGTGKMEFSGIGLRQQP